MILLFYPSNILGVSQIFFNLLAKTEAFENIDNEKVS